MDIRKSRQIRSPIPPITQLVKYALLGTLVISSIFALSQINISRYFPIKTVHVYGLQHVDQTEVQNLLMPLVNHGFFSINVESIKDRLLQMPWVATIFVRRTWPDQVDVTIIEKNAVARWNDESLLSDGGELFSPNQNTYPAHLPLFKGPAGKQMMMLDYFNQMNRLFEPLHAKISYLELTPYLSWKLVLDNQITLQVGHKDILTRLGHFVKVYPKIVGARATDVDYIDLRYPNGIAVQWKTVVKT